MRSSQSSRFMHLSDRTTLQWMLIRCGLHNSPVACVACVALSSPQGHEICWSTQRTNPARRNQTRSQFHLNFGSFESVKLFRFCADRDSEIWIPFCHGSDNLRWRRSYHDLDCISDILLLAACAHITFPHLLLYASCIVIKAAVQTHSIIPQLGLPCWIHNAGIDSFPLKVWLPTSRFAAQNPSEW